MEISHLTGLTVLILFVGIVGIAFFSEKYWSYITLGCIVLNAVLTSFPAILALTGVVQSGQIFLPHNLGVVNIKVDAFSAWFILIINFASINGALYGTGYLKSYKKLTTNLQVHWVSFILFHISMVWVCMFDQGIAFLVVWELMSLSSLVLVIFEFQNKETLKAGINYMIQMHLSVAFLTIGFLWLYFRTGSFSFSALASLPADNQSLWIFAVLMIGFAIKAGFILFHTWLPHAHPAAPSHVSGVMSGVIVKLGIYGIIRVLSYLTHSWLLIGEIVLILSVLTALYGIINSAVSSDFKRMLAFCTIENIGIIGMGIGLGLIGVGIQNNYLSVFGFGGAFLHTLNHSLFKPLLFFAAGNVYQQTHTRNIDHLGGLIKKMPQTAMFFLIGAVAIAGLPPFNGFVSEFLIYSGLIKGLGSAAMLQTVIIIISIAGLAIVGGISLFAFTKNFSTIFLGEARKEFKHQPEETSFIMHLPKYMLVVAMLSVALLPGFYFKYALIAVNSVFGNHLDISNMSFTSNINVISNIGLVSSIFIAILLVVFLLRRYFTRNRATSEYHTWGCGYVAPIPKAQYSGRSFSRPLAGLLSFVLSEKKEYKKITRGNIYPKTRTFASQYSDLLEQYIVTPVSRRLTFLVNYFQFIQNGLVQYYVIYGLFFILLIFLGTLFNIIN